MSEALGGVPAREVARRDARGRYKQPTMRDTLAKHSTELGTPGPPLFEEALAAVERRLKRRRRRR